GGATTHELRAVAEARRVLDQPGLPLDVSAVRTPMFFGLGLSVHLETEEALSPEQAVEVLRPARGVLVHASDEDAYPTPVEVTGSGATPARPTRVGPPAENGPALW